MALGFLDREEDPKRIDSPSNEDDFEDFCLSLFAEIWNDPAAQKFGRRGQRQNGVDIYGFPDKGSHITGIQCKKKNELLEQKLTETEIKAEVEKAKGFSPALSHYIIATTLPRDAELQKIALQITQENKAKGLFSVQICFWDDIKLTLERAKKTLYHYYPEFEPGTDTKLAKLDEIDQTTKTILKNQSEAKERPLIEPQVVEGPKELRPSNETVQSGNQSEAIEHTKIDAFRDLQNSHNPQKALDGLEKLKKDIWAKTTAGVRFRIITNIAAAKLSLGQEAEAAKLFIEAHQYNPEDEKSLSNAAMGNFLLGNKEEGLRILGEVLKKNPSSTRAYSMLAQTSDKLTIEEIAEEIPKPFREAAEVAYAIGTVAHRKGELEKSRDWLEIALKNSDDENTTFDIKASLAEVLLEIETKDPSLIYEGQISEKNRENLLRIISLLEETWSKIATTDIAKYRLSLLANKSLANRLLNKLDEASADIEIALRIDPTNASFKRQKALIAYDRRDRGAAIKVLQDIPLTQENPEIHLILAGFLREQKKDNEAIQTLKTLLEAKFELDPKIKLEAKRLLLQLYLDTNDYEKAAEIAEEITLEEGDNILNLLDKARIARAKGNTDETISILREAKKLITDTTPGRDLLELGHQFYSLDQFEDASDIYVKVTDTNANSQLTKQLINSYYRSGKLDEALTLCHKLQEKYGPLRYASEMESAILEQIGDLPKAKTVCEDYIKKNPDDLEMKIRLAVVNFRLGNFDELEEFLKSDIDLEKISLPSIFQIIGLYQERGLGVKALDLIYESRRKYFSEEEVHLRYIGLFLGREKQDEARFDISEIKPDTAVLLRDAGGKEKWYILENRKDANLERGELNEKHPFFNLLMGKKRGEEILFKKGSIGEESLKIVDIQSKYVRAFQESISSFNQYFPDSKDLVGFSVDISEGGSEGGVKKILTQVSKMNEAQSAVLKYYQEGQLTIGAVARFTGGDLLKTWSALMFKPDLGVRSSLGTTEERVAALQSLAASPAPKLIIDPIGLLTLHGIGNADAVVRKYGKLGIAQSTVDLLRTTVADKKSFESQGFMTIGKEEDQFVKQEITKEQIEESVKYFNGILDWIRQNCDVIPVEGALKIKHSEVLHFEEMLGKPSFDTVLIAAQPDRVLYSDDERLRNLAQFEFKTKGVWTQLLLMDLLDKNQINLKDYSKAIIKLVNSNYNHISISKDVLVEAAEQSKWEFTTPLDKMLLQLKEGRSDEISSIRVAVEFLSILWGEPLIEAKKEIITTKILDTLTEGRNTEEVLVKFIALIRARFHLNPLVRERIFAIVRAWQKIHLI